MMGEENYVEYNEKTARDIVKNGNFRDHNGEEIGSLENILTFFGGIMYGFGVVTCLDCDDINLIKHGIKLIEQGIDNYIAIRYCYKKDTSIHDNLLNKVMDSVPDLAERVKYKLIN